MYTTNHHNIWLFQDGCDHNLPTEVKIPPYDEKTVKLHIYKNNGRYRIRINGPFPETNNVYKIGLKLYPNFGNWVRSDYEPFIIWSEDIVFKD